MPATAVQPAKWNAADYAANSAAQLIWARELIAQLSLRGDEHILDVGCGDGKVTAELSCAVPKGSVTGIDASPEMIRFARKTFPPGKHPNLEFQVMDARDIRLARQFDIVFSSSVLHWVDDHPAFLRGAAACLCPGGRLVVSCGGKGNAQDVFVALRPEMRLKQWRDFFPEAAQTLFLSQSGGLRKMAAVFWLQNAQRQAVAQGCGLSGTRPLYGVVSHHLAALHPARAGRLARKVHCRCRGPLSRETSARRGGLCSRPHGAAGN